ncbi:ABC transporter ATP-binding protein [Acidilutibacter cellobiosedens]|jgi:ATP-binding cassette subfamily C protein|uniref:ABC transporter ATP-binding protein n=1 Tax=Acidilutibacter cellobiosedens TaxID=2507161 RepID=A0A410QDS2_9FIRM|nr:ABC transporter ATP-binding protein [Acidilutibacter cellobiosedens]MBE6081290.1 ABC transporter ATP-binding protein [Tissierellaceae bacterium]QAT62182.1 ABC transporter ATP-binding protein [Acidilutibacter cellobiosedens]
MRDILFGDKKGIIKFFIGIVFSAVTTILLQLIFTVVLYAVSPASQLSLKAVLFILITISILNPILYLISRIFRIGFIRDALSEIRKKIFESVLHKSYKEYFEHLTSEYLSRLTNDISQFESNFFPVLLENISAILVYIFSFGIIFINNRKIALGLFSASMLFLVFTFFLRKYTKELQLGVNKTNSKLMKIFSDFLGGLQELKMNLVEKAYADRINWNVELNEKVKFNQQFLYSILRIGKEFFSIVTPIIIFYIGIMYFDLEISSKLLSIVLPFSISMFSSISEIGFSYNRMKAAYDILDGYISEKTADDYDIGRDFRFEKEIEIKDFSFAYDSRKILQSSDFEIERGKKYLLLGKSGSGKSTFLKCISGMNKSFSGEIKYDGCDIRKISLKKYFENVSFLTQDVFLFNDTVENNIKLYKAESEELYQKIIRLMGIEKITSDNNPYLTLSGGEKEKVSLARELIKEPKLILLDEMTKGLDEENSRRIEDIILSGDFTVINATHKLIKDIHIKYDYVIQIVDGKIRLMDSASYWRNRDEK